MAKISVIIPAHNRLEQTKKCLQWLFDGIEKVSRSEMISVVFIDDGSCDGTSGWVSEHYPEVILLRGDGNLWWSGAVNLGTNHALKVLRAEHILLWNNDIKPASDYFINLLNIIDHQNLGADTIVGSKTYFMDRPGVIRSMGAVFNPVTGAKKVIGANQTDSSKYEKIIDADWCGGMGTLIHKSVFDKIGFWDEKTFPQYHADGDYILRAKKHGLKLLIYPNLKVYNDASTSAVLHNNSFMSLIKSFFSLRSHYNISKNIRFYKRHAESWFAYSELIKTYTGYIGGFFKWKILGLLGIKRKSV